MKLEILTKCGPVTLAGVDEEAGAAFLDDYRNGDDAVLSVPDGDAETTRLYAREAVWGAVGGPDDPEEPEEPEEPPVDLPEPEESETA